MHGYAQESKPVYFEKAGDDRIRFYYDAGYYLVDKNCEFKRIERVASFDPKTSLFIGPFTDFNQQGQVILEGEYKQGIKHGVFKAYHANMQLKWQVRYEQGVAVGDWTFYYPDGKPMMVISYDSEFPKISSFWNTTGSQMIQEGNGKYDFKIPYLGFNPYGFPFVRLRGNISNGYPVGKWRIYFEDDKDMVLVGEEYYEKTGVFAEGYDLYTESIYTNAKYPIGPIDEFFRAEALVSKACNYDEQIDFTSYLAKSFTDIFKGAEVPNFSYFDLKYTIRIRKDGSVDNFDLLSKTDPRFDKLFFQALRNIQTYPPSFKNGEYIDDELTVELKAQRAGDGSVVFHSLSIHRKEENS